MNPADLERLLDRELQRLPAPRAPETLLPRVMAAVDAAARRPWYTQAWFTWPVGWQVASIAVAVIALTGVVMALPMLLPGVTSVARQAPVVADVSGEVSAAAARVESVTTAARVLWRALLAPVVPYAFGLVLLMSLACALFGTVLNHLVFGKALR
jgi:hypothetical protein